MVIMELKSTLDNPAFDGRKRSGWQSHKQFVKGTRFALIGSAAGLCIRFIEDQDETDNTLLVTTLLANATPATARNFREVSVTLPEATTPEAILDRLLESGRLSEQDIRGAAISGIQT